MVKKNLNLNKYHETLSKYVETFFKCEKIAQFCKIKYGIVVNKLLKMAEKLINFHISE